MMEVILAVRSLRKAFGTNLALAGLDLDVCRGEKLGIIGPNGSGKTTLINCITGVLRPDSGAVRFEGSDISSWPAWRRARGGIARTFQIPRPFAGISVAANLRVPLDYVTGKGPKANREHELLALVGLQARAHHPAEQLTQLELRKLELARALATEPRLLIVDEVMAGLSEAEINDVLDIMHAIMRFSQRLICMETGRIIADGTPSQVGGDPEVRRVYFGKQAHH
jgi:branched-chain amino acid transport system ATP-binding protein